MQPTGASWGSLPFTSPFAKRGLNHSDQPVAGQCRVEHRQVTRLENIQRKLPRRQEKCAGQRKDGDRIWQIAGL